MTPRKRYEEALKGNFDSIAEGVFAKSPMYAFLFAKNVLNTRFVAGEKAIKNSGAYSSEYAFFLGERFIEGELAISEDQEAWNKYVKFFAEKGIEVKNVEVDAWMAYEELHKLVKQYGELFDDYKQKNEEVNKLFAKNMDLIALSAKYVCLFTENIHKKRFYNGESVLQEEENKKYWNLYVKYLKSIGIRVKKEKISSWRMRDTYNNARYAYGEELKKYERILAQSIKYSYLYATLNGKEVSEAIEKTIAKSAKYSVLYARHKKQRFERGEKAIVKVADMALSYVRSTMKCRWEACEENMRKSFDTWLSYLSLLQEFGVEKETIENLCQSEKARILAEQDSHNALSFAKSVVKGRWEEAEHLFVGHNYMAFNYANDCLKGERVDAIEDIIAKDHDYSLNYARGPLNGQRFEKGEKAIKDHGYTAFQYVRDVAKCRWEEAEEAIKKADLWDRYVSFLKEIDSTFEDWESLQKRYLELGKEMAALKIKLDKKQGIMRGGRVLEL